MNSGHFRCAVSAAQASLSAVAGMLAAARPWDAVADLPRGSTVMIWASSMPHPEIADESNSRPECFVWSAKVAR